MDVKGHNSELKLHELAIDKIDEIMAFRDTAFKLVFFNEKFSAIAKKLFGVTPYVGMNTLEMLPEDAKKHWRPIIDSVLSGTEYRDEFTFDFGENEVRFYDISLIPVYIKDELVGCVELNRDITARKELENKLKASNIKLENALAEIKTLQGIIPICSYCHSIRNDQGAWEMMEAYISKHSEANFSHGICPKCYEIERKKMDDI